MITRERRAEIRKWLARGGDGHITPSIGMVEGIALLDALDAAESKPMPHPTLRQEIDVLEATARTVQGEYASTLQLAIQSVLAELHSLRAILADKIEESCAADHVRARYRRDVAAQLLMWAARSMSDAVTTNLNEMARSLITLHMDAAARGDLAPFYARVDAMK